MILLKSYFYDIIETSNINKIKKFTRIYAFRFYLCLKASKYYFWNEYFRKSLITQIFYKSNNLFKEKLSILILKNISKKINKNWELGIEKKLLC